MSESLVHTPEDVVNRWEQSDDLLIGRVGPAHLHHSPWPTDPQELPQRFVAGVLHPSPDTSQGAGRSEPLSPSSLSTLRGFYAVAESQPGGEFLLAVDRRASIPVYYAEIEGYLTFAPEIRALLAHPGLSASLDPGAVASLLASGHLIGNQTLLATVRRLRGGHVLRVQDGRCEPQAYWRFRPGSGVGRESDEELELELGRLVRGALRRNLGDPGKTVIFLSGGADSRGILGAALEAADGDGARLQTVTWGTSEHGRNADADIAARLAAATNVRHRFMRRSTSGYGQHFGRGNSLIGSASDVVAYHPLEYSFMQDLRSAGFERALRGDEALGWSAPVPNIATAVTRVKLHRLGEDSRLRTYIDSRYYEEWCRASDAALTSVEEEVRGSAPDDAKDYLYFAHRLEGYLNTASYYKLVWLDQRNVLLDEDILDFYERVPAALRADKLLYRRAMARAFPQLWALPFATASSLEDWRSVLAADEEVRRFIQKSLDDEQSPVWEFFDRRALALLFESTSPSFSGRSISGRMRSSVRALLLRLPDPVVRSLQGFRSSRLPFRLPAHAILLRVLVVKQFVDETASVL
ncbi:MAG: asparagine synthase-related protein [Actinomycetota bacterium]|nr:asparagine synthase-related protein [Actinomycetota bacterium]